MQETNMPSPQGQSVGLTRDCRVMPLSSGSLDAYIWNHLLSFKEKKITQRAVHSSSFQNHLSGLTQGGLGSPYSSGMWEDLGSFLSLPEGTAAHYFTSFQTQHCGFSHKQQSSPAVAFPQLAANLLRQREEQALWWNSRCPHPGTIMTSSMHSTKEGLRAQKCICFHHHPLETRHVIKTSPLLTNSDSSSISVHWGRQQTTEPCTLCALP